MHTDITGKICTAAFKKHQNILVYALIGALVFIAVFGILPLNVAYDHWILNGYVEADIIQHYAGWLAYRQSTWSWPLGLTEGLGNGAITFTDSIPVLSILCKMIERILPETFQFFGPYVFFCIILQGIAAGKILELLTDDYKIILGGTLLFCASPILLERAFRHTALASHWLILFSIYLLIKSRQTKSMSWKYVLLSVLAIGIHPYFLPMIYAIFVTNALELAVHSFQHIKRVCFIFFTSIFATALFGYAIGALGAGGLSGGGFGIFSMNINALINPTSCGGLVWSKALPILPQILGNYDGFNYLGLGCIIAVPIALLYIYIYIYIEVRF